MDSTSVVTLVSTICVAVFGIAVTVGAFYGILVLLPRYQNKKIEDLKAKGRQGKATILRVPEQARRPYSSRNSMYTLVNIGLEIDVPGIDIYQVDKTFTFPTGWLSALEEGKVVDVWVDPGNPRDLSKIVIHVK